MNRKTYMYGTRMYNRENDWRDSLGLVTGSLQWSRAQQSKGCCLVMPKTYDRRNL